MNIRLQRIALLTATIAALLAVRALAQPARPDGPDDRPPGPPATQPTTELSGSVDAFNVGPRGLPESLMLKTSADVVQVNFAPFLDQTISQAVQIGDEVKITAVKDREDDRASHALYRMNKLVNEKDQTIAEDNFTPPRDVHIDATVKRLNYGRRGEVNGIQLDTGDFVHFPPDAADDLKLKPGDKVSIDGKSHSTPGGHAVIGASKINGTEIQPPQQRGPGGPGGPDDQRGPDQRDNNQGGPGGDQRPDGPPPGQ